MGKLQVKIANEAYVGKQIKYQGKQYKLAPELTKGGCQGCALYSTNGCTTEVTSQCLQGYILNRE